jgi:hypothetical protein
MGRKAAATTGQGSRVNCQPYGEVFNPQIRAKARGGPYTVVDHHDCVMIYLMTGRVAEIQRITGIERRIVTRWMKTDWWEAMEAQCQKILADQLTNRMRGVAMRCFDQLHDRLTEGDIHLGQGGQVYRAPINAARLGTLGSMAANHTRLSEGKPTSIKENQLSLQELAEAFRTVSKSNAVEVIDVTPE